MDWLSDILGTGASANETNVNTCTSAVNPALEALLSQVQREVIEKPSASEPNELDDFDSMLANIGNGSNANGEIAPINREARRNRVYGGPELFLVQDEFEELHEIADHGHSELVKLPRQLLISLLMDHSRLIDRLYKN
jgi:hypothetical protein